jgi:hypothetical protein
MPKIELQLEVEQIARMLEALSEEELETLELMLQPELTAELRRRRQDARTELQQGRTLSTTELFVD